MTQATPETRRRAPLVGAASAALLMGLAACGEDPFNFDWTSEATPDTVLLYSLARPELNLVSGFNFFQRRTIRVEHPDESGAWDIAVDTEGASLVLLPPGALGIVARAGIVDMGALTLDDIREAPADTAAYEMDEAVPLVAGNVYVVRTNRRQGGFGTTCVYYGKLTPVVLDVAGGVLQFSYVRSPACNNRDLVPTKD